MWDISINRKQYDIVRNSKEMVNVNMDGCPQDKDSVRPCHAHTSHVIYNGTGNFTVDYDLESFTGQLLARRVR